MNQSGHKARFGTGESYLMRHLYYLTLPLAMTAGTAWAEDLPANTDGASDTEIEIATGADYSVGDYGAPDDTRVWSIPLDLKVRSGRVRLQASLSYVFVNGPGQVVGGVIVPTPGGVTTSRSGIGDLNLSGGYTLVNEDGGVPMIELGGAVKLPTAKTTIGTGKADFTASASVYKSLGSTVMLFGTVGYSWLGSPAQYALKNGVMASGGLNLRPDDSQNYGVSLAWREPVAAGYAGQAVVSPYMTYRINKHFGITLYGMAGLNDASPRAGGGLRLSLFQ